MVWIRMPCLRVLQKVSIFVMHRPIVAATLLSTLGIVFALTIVFSTALALCLDQQTGVLKKQLAALHVGKKSAVFGIAGQRQKNFVQIMAAPPMVADVMQTLQRVAGKENAIVESLQSEMHPPTAATLARLDLVLSIKASYQSILILVQQVLDRYPGATLCRLSLTHPLTVTSTIPSTMRAVGDVVTSAQFIAEARTEATVTLSFWSRPLGVAMENSPSTRKTEPSYQVAHPSVASASEGT
jgi:hypothetical protein